MHNPSLPTTSLSHVVPEKTDLWSTEVVNDSHVLFPIGPCKATRLSSSLGAAVGISSIPTLVLGDPTNV